jgi:signal transduction histidine kinase
LLAESNAAPVPLLLIDLPLHEEGTNHLAGVAQFLMNGESIAREYKDLDQHLALQGSIVFVICGAIISAGLALAFRRVQKANALLAERTTNLLRANRELALAAKTSAIGAVTSHLIHGLKNPLSGLRSFVQERASDNSETSDWELAVASTQRMQQLIDRVVRVLQEQNTASEYEVTLPEMLEMIEVKLKPLAEASGVHLDCSAAAKGSVSNREADLILLILENLVQNAIEATPKGRTVQLRVRNESNLLLFEVEDSGAGLSPEQVARLFTPCTSSKKGGSGIGLTISRQLAIHLGATLELKETSIQGTRFCLGLPLHQHREETLIHTNLKHR